LNIQLELSLGERRVPKWNDKVIDWDSVSGLDLAFDERLALRYLREVHAPWSVQERRRKAGRRTRNEAERSGRPCPNRRADRSGNDAGGVGEPVSLRKPRMRPGPDTSGPGGHVEPQSPPPSTT
jgi:hypothetical protein